LSENSGYNPIEYVSKLKEEQINEKNDYVGVDALHRGTTNMME
jgi:chaperonin GroEL (HSP60 family)